MKSFFGHLDFEVYFSPKDSWKLVKDTRGIVGMIAGGAKGNSATTIEIVDSVSA